MLHCSIDPDQSLSDAAPSRRITMACPGNMDRVPASRTGATGGLSWQASVAGVVAGGVVAGAMTGAVGAAPQPRLTTVPMCGNGMQCCSDVAVPPRYITMAKVLGRLPGEDGLKSGGEWLRCRPGRICRSPPGEHQSMSAFPGVNRPLISLRLRRFGTALLLLPVIGCASLGPAVIPRDRTDYLSSIADSWKEQTLLNVVRLRYGDAPSFLDVSSVVTPMLSGASYPLAP